MVQAKSSFRKTVIQESFWTLIATLASRAGGLVFTILLARILMPEGFGLYSLALSISILFITFADMGINQTLLRYISFSIEKDRKKASAYFYYILGLKVKVTSIAAAILLVSSYPLAHFAFNKPALFPLLVILSIYTFISALQGFFESLFYTNNNVSKLAIKESVFQILRIVFVFMILGLFAWQKTLSAVIGLLIASILTLILIFYFYKKIFNFKRNNVEINKKRVLVFISFLMLSSLAGVLFSYMDTIIMGLFLSLEYIGYYRAAISLVITIAGALSFPGVFLSAMTKIHYQKMQEPFDKIIKTLLIFVIPATIGVISLSQYFIVLLYGHEYLAATPILYILSPFIFLFVTTSIFLNVLVAKEKTRDFSLLTLSCTLLNIFLIVLTIKLLLPFSEMAATLGAASATLASWVIYFIGSVLILRWRMNIQFKFRHMLKPLIASVIMAIVLHFFKSYYSNMTLFTGIIGVLLGVIVYFAVLFLMGEIKKHDLIFLLSLLPQYRLKHMTNMFLRSFVKAA